jgi:hypothetical protein
MRLFHFQTVRAFAGFALPRQGAARGSFSRRERSGNGIAGRAGSAFPAARRVKKTSRIGGKRNASLPAAGAGPLPRRREARDGTAKKRGTVWLFGIGSFIIPRLLVVCHLLSIES